MNSNDTIYGKRVLHKFSSLRDLEEKRRNETVKHRVATNPHPTGFEYLVGAFIEMYAPYLKSIIHRLYKKGYVIDTSSGFCGKYGERQAVIGYFPINDITRGKLNGLGVKVHIYTNTKSIMFYPEKADIDKILTKWEKIASILPDRKQAIQPVKSIEASRFRSGYIPQSPTLRRQRLFEHLREKVQEEMVNGIKKRLATNLVPTKIESSLGVFVEMLEPQVRAAVLAINRKGYSTDVSGFKNQADGQMIEGDFKVDKATTGKLEKLGVKVETNPSGYTRVQFSPDKADIKKIKLKWDRITSLLPDKGYSASPSMTRKARDFRSKYVKS